VAVAIGVAGTFTVLVNAAVVPFQLATHSE
jgi:hypothetical protein